MRRALAILKYLPPVLCGLLVCAWVKSASFTYPTRYVAGPTYSVGCDHGNAFFIGYWGRSGKSWPSFFDLSYSNPPPRVRFYLWRTAEQIEIRIPMLFVMTLLAPLAAVPFFRFPLWFYFAWTALIAAELAIYLR